MSKATFTEDGKLPSFCNMGLDLRETPGRGPVWKGLSCRFSEHPSVRSHSRYS